MDIWERYDAAMASPSPDWSFGRIADELAAEGHSREEVLSIFHEFLARVQQTEPNESPKQDAVLDVMDCITGWCQPRNAIKFQS